MKVVPLTSLGLWICLGMLACGPLSKKKDDSDDEEDTPRITLDDDIKDYEEVEPDWATDVSISCDWGQIHSETRVGLQCQVVSSSADFSLIPSLQVKTSPKDYRGEKWVTVKELGLTQTSSSYIVSLDEARFKMIEFRFEFDEGEFQREFKLKDLPGMEEEKGILACMVAENHAKSCTDQAGLNLPLADGVEYQAPKSICETKPDGMPEDPMCSLNFDAKVKGTGGQIDQWFARGTEFIGTDGKVKSTDLCNEYGIYKVSRFAQVDTTPRYFPWLPQGGSVCFRRFEEGAPKGSFLASNPEHGVNGEPYCYFALIKQNETEDIKTSKLYVILNPKLFPAARFKDFNPQKFQDTAEFLECP
jgi:hypothetical protein